MNQRFSRGELWVVAQVVLLAAQAAAVWWFWAPAPLGVRLSGGLVVLVGLGLAAASVLRLGRNLTPNPRPLDDARLVTSGVYALVRHPIYLSLILVAAGLALASASPWCGLGAAAVLVFFDRKSAREERWLREKYPDYAAYARRVRKLVPWVSTGPMKNQAFNPYLPSYEYIPDAELYCMNDYVCWSAPVDDLADWRYDGVIYRKTQDPMDPEGRHQLYAPDVTKGPDGRYYLYYAFDFLSVMSVAVADGPAKRFCGTRTAIPFSSIRECSPTTTDGCGCIRASRRCRRSPNGSSPAGRRPSTAVP